MVAALLARGLEPFAAACAAVVAHARAGRDAAERIGAAESVIADRRDRLDPGRIDAHRESSAQLTTVSVGETTTRWVWRSNNLGRAMKTAAEIMDADVPTVTPDEDARAAIDLLAKTDMGAIPVVDEDRKVVGIVSESDLILSDEESDLHLPHYLNIMGGIVFVGSMKGFEERLEQGVRDQGLRADDRRPGRRRRRRRRRDGRRRRSPTSTTTTCPWSTATAASPASSPGPTRSPRSSTAKPWQRAVARIDLGAVRATAPA